MLDVFASRESELKVIGINHASWLLSEKPVHCIIALLCPTGNYRAGVNRKAIGTSALFIHIV